MLVLPTSDSLDQLRQCLSSYAVILCIEMQHMIGRRAEFIGSLRHQLEEAKKIVSAVAKANKDDDI